METKKKNQLTLIQINFVVLTTLLQSILYLSLISSKKINIFNNLLCSVKKQKWFHIFQCLFFLTQKNYLYSIWFCRVPLNLKFSNQIKILSVFSDIDATFGFFIFYQTFITRFLKKGLNSYIFKTFCIFLQYLKQTYNICGYTFIMEEFKDNFYLPYKVYNVKLSNRQYLFPGPLSGEDENRRIILKAFVQVIKKRSENFFLDRFANEIISYIFKTDDSFLLNHLNNILRQGMENRAYVHYRWLLKL